MGIRCKEDEDFFVKLRAISKNTEDLLVCLLLKLEREGERRRFQLFTHTNPYNYRLQMLDHN